MQELLADTLPYLAAFYLIELAVSLGRHHLFFASIGRRWRLMTAGLGVLPPSPGAEAIASHALPLLLEAEGIWFPDPLRPYAPRVLGSSDLRHLEFEGMGEVTSERKKILASERLIAVAPTPESAAAVAARLESLRHMTAEARVGALDAQQRDSTDLAALRELRASHSAFAPWIRAAAWLLFLLLLAVLPWQVYLAPKLQLDLASLALDAGVLLLVNGCLAAGMLFRMGRGAKEVLRRVAPLVLLPFSALHPLLHLSRDLYVRFHWSALAAVLLPREELRVRARQELRRIALCCDQCGAAELNRAWKREQGHWARVLDQLEEPLEPLLADPAPGDPSAATYCPLCSATFRIGASRCADCDAELRPVGAQVGRALT